MGEEGPLLATLAELPTVEANTSDAGGDDCPPVVESVSRKPKAITARLDPEGEGFLDFWKIYPRRVGKVDAEKAWKQTAKIRPSFEKLKRAMLALADSENWTKDNGTFIPHPATWLRRGGWDDETPEVADDEYAGTQQHLLSREEAQALNQRQYGMDFRIDYSHVPAWTAMADAAGMTPKKFAEWRLDWGLKHGPYTAALPVPRVAAPSMEAK